MLTMKFPAYKTIIGGTLGLTFAGAALWVTWQDEAVCQQSSAPNTYEIFSARTGQRLGIMRVSPQQDGKPDEVGDVTISPLLGRPSPSNMMYVDPQSGLCEIYFREAGVLTGIKTFALLEGKRAPQADLNPQTAASSPAPANTN